MITVCCTASKTSRQFFVRGIAPNMSPVIDLFRASGWKNVLRKLLHIPYRRLKAGFSVTALTVTD